MTLFRVIFLSVVFVFCRCEFIRTSLSDCLAWLSCLHTQLLGLVIGAVLSFIYFSIVGLAPLASYFFATAQKSNQKRPPHIVCPTNAAKFSKRRGDASQKTKAKQDQKIKSTRPKKYKQTEYTPLLKSHSVFDFDLPSHLSKPFRVRGYHESSGPVVWASFASSGPAW